jgi:hypothetical protein
MEPNLSSRKYVDPISHDGIRDSLTKLASPKFFYESLARECARSDRDSTPLTAVRFLLMEDVDGSGLRESTSDYEIAIINFSKVLIMHSRRSDLSARMARFEFISLLVCAELDTQRYVNRVRDGYRGQGFLPRASSILRTREEEPLSILNRLDQALEIN